ncbi:thioredoxin-like protein [Aspergillus steynii IBT 23096]|uniref:Thioredoxin-like protein n=1 Tax=Aspergillus steynii IBT 23096 TaxID=1392250 RepID=A0A2I2GHE8_9EURO|nr:thioredoxin-like protein [Aspergillus steynii IBT 23096]PLB52301.1 thioredoxin-like protein [Aspergillus steynii IBT 23096]
MPLDQITDQAQFDSAIKDHQSTIVIFSAVWSGISEATKRNYENVGSQYSGLYQAWIDIDESPDLAQKYSSNGIPTIIGFKNGAQVEKYIGPQVTEGEAKRFIEKVL